MSQIDKTVFISYRRTNKFTALAIFKELTAKGYDVFFDYTSIKTGDFSQIILREIRARGHFLIILTPSALQRCNEPGDWVRREIEYAIEHKRHIIPLMFDGFDFGDMAEYMTGDLALLRNYNGLRVPVDYFDAAMERLTDDYLNIPINTVLHPTPTDNLKDVQTTIQFASSQPTPDIAQLSAEDYFERALKRPADDLEGRIRDYNQAIAKRPDFAEAYNNRGIAHFNNGDYNKAVEDYTLSIEYNNPELFRPYISRGNVYFTQEKYDLALADYDEAIRLNPEDDEAYNNRGVIYRKRGRYNQALEDFHTAMKYNPTDASPYLNAGLVHENLGNFKVAIENFEKYIDLDGRRADEVKGWIADNKAKLDSQK